MLKTLEDVVKWSLLLAVTFWGVLSHQALGAEQSGRLAHISDSQLGLDGAGEEAESDLNLGTATPVPQDLRGVDFTGTDLTGIDIRGADLRGANLSRAAGFSFVEALVQGAVVDETTALPPRYNSLESRILAHKVAIEELRSRERRAPTRENSIAKRLQSELRRLKKKLGA